jgi:hypothetical protein
MTFTVDECQAKAADKLAQAGRNIGRIKKKLQDEAKYWLELADRLRVDSAG